EERVLHLAGRPRAPDQDALQGFDPLGRGHPRDAIDGSRVPQNFQRFLRRPERILSRTVRPILSLGAVAVVSLVIFALKPVAPVLSLGVLYLFAVLPVAALCGLGYA